MKKKIEELKLEKRDVEEKLKSSEKSYKEKKNGR